MRRFFPLEKYKYHIFKNQVIAESTYEGKRVKASAKCDPSDTFDVEKGKALAAARCNERIAEKRYKRAKRKVNEASLGVIFAQNHYYDMIDYEKDAKESLIEARKATDKLLMEI